MGISWLQGLITVVVLFYVRVSCCSRKEKDARSKLLHGTSASGDDGESGGGGGGGSYGTVKTASSN